MRNWVDGVINVIRKAVLDSTVGRVDDFLCIDPNQFSNPPRKAGDRAITEISQRELNSAINVVQARTHPRRRDDLVKEVATQLGYTRVGGTIKSVLEAQIDESSNFV